MIVTGASRGIGLAITQALLDEGVKVAGWSRNAPEELTHGHFFHFEVDLTKESSVQYDMSKRPNNLAKCQWKYPDYVGLHYNAR